MKYYKQSPFYLLADIVKHLENPIKFCISGYEDLLETYISYLIPIGLS